MLILMRERLGVVRDLLIERPKGSAGRECLVLGRWKEVGTIVDLHVYERETCSHD